MGRTLLDLPSELIAGVFQCLDDVDIFAGREANKQLERASFSLFAKRFFRKKGYMITTPSIKVLKSVAAHEQLRPYVQHVWFNPDCFTFGALEFIKPDNDFKKANPYEENRKGEQLPFFTADEQNRYEAYSACIEDYQRLIYSEEELARELTTAFSTLPNLKAVGMRRSDQHSPWGWSHIKDAVGHDPRDLGDIPDSPSFMLSGSTQLYIALMKSLGTSGAKIQRLYTDAIEIDDIPPQTLPQDVVHAACNSVLYLEINATKGNLLTVPIPSTIITRRRSQTTSGLAQLLAATSRLRELGLMVFPDRKQSHLIAPQPQEPSSWRQTYPYKTISHLSKSVELGNLRRLKLEKLTLSSEILLTFLRPSAQHLTSLKLRDIRLLPNNEEAPNTLSPEIKPWRAIFSFLSTSTPRLSYLLLYHLSHATGGIRFVPNLPANPPQDPHDSDEALSNEGEFTDHENIAVEVGTPHSDPGLLGPERRRELVRAREAVRERVGKLVEGHWYGRNVFGYDMDEMVWHTDTSDEEW